MNNRTVLFAVLIMGGITFALRALPFAALQRISDAPLVRFAGRMMPPGVMVVLIVYNVSSVSLAERPYGLPTLFGILVTAGVHHWRRSPLLSIAAGTATNMVLLHLLS